MISDKIIPDNLFANGKTFDKYNIGSFYNEYVLPKQYYPYQFDGWSDKLNYGIYDNKNNIIYPRNEFLKEYQNDTGVQHKNLSFVVDAFLDFKKYQDGLLKTTKLNNASIYSRLNVYSSTPDVPSLYLKYLTSVYNVFRRYYLNDISIKQITNINTFLNSLLTFLKLYLKIAPINRSSYIKNSITPKNINGLYISLDNPDNQSFRNVANNYINNPEFDKFITTAGFYGFYVDRNRPWILVADLESPAMKKYIDKYNLKTTNDIFSTCYFKASSVDMESLKNVILSFWNTFAAEQGTIIEQNNILNCSKMFAQVSSLNQLDIETFENYYNINWQLRMYLYIRILEEDLNITQNKFEILFEEACKINKLQNVESAIDFITLKVNELLARSKKQTVGLTSEDEIVKLLAANQTGIATFDLNF